MSDKKPPPDPMAAPLGIAFLAAAIFLPEVMPPDNRGGLGQYLVQVLFVLFALGCLVPWLRDKDWF